MRFTGPGVDWIRTSSEFERRIGGVHDRPKSDYPVSRRVDRSVFFTLIGLTGRDGGTDDAEGSADGRDGPVRELIQWVLLYGSRRLLALFISIAIMLSLLLVGTTWPFEMERLVTETRAVQTLFNTLLGGLILFVSVVLSINTAALSQEFAPLRVKLSQIEDSIEFQVELEEFADEGVSPAGIGPFFEFIIRTIRSETTTLGESAERLERGRQQDDLLAFVDGIEAALSRIEDRLWMTNPRLSLVLLSGLDYPYAEHINAARRLRATHGSDLDEQDRQSVEVLLRALTIFASGRQYFTTLYFKRELRNLSRDLVVLALPVIVFTSYVLLAIDANLFPSVALPGVEPRFLYVNLAFVITLSPYILLSAYMLRIVTVSKHSLESTVFTLERPTRPENEE